MGRCPRSVSSLQMLLIAQFIQDVSPGLMALVQPQPICCSYLCPPRQPHGVITPGRSWTPREEVTLLLKISHTFISGTCQCDSAGQRLTGLFQMLKMLKLTFPRSFWRAFLSNSRKATRVSFIRVKIPCNKKAGHQRQRAVWFSHFSSLIQERNAVNEALSDIQSCFSNKWTHFHYNVFTPFLDYWN